MLRDWLKYFVGLTVIVFVCLLSMMISFAIRESFGLWGVLLFLVGQTALCAYLLVLLNKKEDKK